MSRVRRFPFMVEADPELRILDPSFFTDPISEDNSLTHEGPWSITVFSEGVVEGSEPPTYTVQVSNDGIDWFDYSKSATGVLFINSVEDDHLAYNNIRLSVNPNGASAGTAEAFFNYRG